MNEIEVAGGYVVRWKGKTWDVYVEDTRYWSGVDESNGLLGGLKMIHRFETWKDESIRELAGL